MESLPKSLIPEDASLPSIPFYQIIDKEVVGRQTGRPRGFAWLNIQLSLEQQGHYPDLFSGLTETQKQLFTAGKARVFIHRSNIEGTFRSDSLDNLEIVIAGLNFNAEKDRFEANGITKEEFDYKKSLEERRRRQEVVRYDEEVVGHQVAEKTMAYVRQALSKMGITGEDADRFAQTFRLRVLYSRPDGLTMDEDQITAYLAREVEWEKIQRTWDTEWAEFAEKEALRVSGEVLRPGPWSMEVHVGFSELHASREDYKFALEFDKEKAPLGKSIGKRTEATILKKLGENPFVQSDEYEVSTTIESEPNKPNLDTCVWRAVLDTDAMLPALGRDGVPVEEVKEIRQQALGLKNKWRRLRQEIEEEQKRAKENKVATNIREEIVVNPDETEEKVLLKLERWPYELANLPEIEGVEWKDIGIGRREIAGYANSENETLLSKVPDISGEWDSNRENYYTHDLFLTGEGIENFYLGSLRVRKSRRRHGYLFEMTGVYYEEKGQMIEPDLAVKEFLAMRPDLDPVKLKMEWRIVNPSNS